MIRNPILPGSNPDPSILRVGEGYYIATSTFEWFPGIQIHHSKDLVDWELITRPLDETRLLDLSGAPDSSGIWAPCLTHSDGLFYLVYTNVRSWDDGPYKIVYNYLTTAPRIDGPWSDPIFLNGSGFDPSFFHDDDGRKWLVNMEWDHREVADAFTGILLQEYCPKTERLIGPVQKIFEGTGLGLVEGPHLYKHKGYYYLLTAEGGTEYDHAVSIARSRKLEGPYQTHPQNPLLTSVGAPGADLQKAGHGSLVETPEGDWYLAHLCGRPMDGNHCILGRETALQKVRWRSDGWIELDQGGSTPLLEIDAPSSVKTVEHRRQNQTTSFNDTSLDIQFQSLRRPITNEWLSLEASPGKLRLFGQEPTTSLFKQSLVARRIQAFQVTVETCLHFDPPSFQQMAGLIAYYNTQNHYYLRVSRDEVLGRSLNLVRFDAGQSSESRESEISLPENGPIYLGFDLETESIQFRYSIDSDNWILVGPSLPSKILSDDYQTLGFTGAFAGVCAQDIAGHRHPADFESFTYVENE